VAREQARKALERPNYFAVAAFAPRADEHRAAEAKAREEAAAALRKPAFTGERRSWFRRQRLQANAELDERAAANAANARPLFTGREHVAESAGPSQGNGVREQIVQQLLQRQLQAQQAEPPQPPQQQQQQRAPSSPAVSLLRRLSRKFSGSGKSLFAFEKATLERECELAEAREGSPSAKPDSEALEKTLATLRRGLSSKGSTSALGQVDEGREPSPGERESEGEGAGEGEGGDGTSARAEPRRAAAADDDDDEHEDPTER
jgi:hypothetical protein